MICKWCEKDINGKLSVHINGRHRKNLKIYFQEFPEQEKEYEKSKPPPWNKGLTKENHSGIAAGAKKVKKSYTKKRRKQYSLRMKEKYKDGDILSPEKRAKVVKAGSKGWSNKVKNASFEERREMLKNFTTAGNKAQKEKRKKLTPQDYERLYPWGKGKARYYNCDYCGKEMIAWFGGKPRPKKRFCNQNCYSQYLERFPDYGLKNGNVIYFYSNKMNQEFCIRSKLELWICEMLESSEKIKSWITTPYIIWYLDNQKRKKRYYPDFLINNDIMLEVKSRYVSELQKDLLELKLKAALKFAKSKKLNFQYWQFDQRNLTKKKVMDDERVKKYILG